MKRKKRRWIFLSAQNSRLIRDSLIASILIVYFGNEFCVCTLSVCLEFSFLFFSSFCSRQIVKWVDEMIGLFIRLPNNILLSANMSRPIGSNNKSCSYATKLIETTLFDSFSSRTCCVRRATKKKRRESFPKIDNTFESNRAASCPALVRIPYVKYDCVIWRIAGKVEINMWVRAQRTE